MWWRIKNTEDESNAAALVVSRLQGSPYRMALAMRIVRDGVTYEGDDAICLPSVSAGIDPVSGVPFDAQPSGLQTLLAKLKVDHRLHDHDEQQEVMDAFFLI